MHGREWISLSEENTLMLVDGINGRPLTFTQFERAIGKERLIQEGDRYYPVTEANWGGLLRLAPSDIAVIGLISDPLTSHVVLPEEVAIGRLALRSMYWDRVRRSLLEPELCSDLPWNNLAVSPFVYDAETTEGYLLFDYQDRAMINFDFGGLGANIGIDPIIPEVLAIESVQTDQGARRYTPTELGISEDTAKKTALSYWEMWRVYGETLQEAACETDLSTNLHDIVAARRDDIKTDPDLWKIILESVITKEKADLVIASIYRRWKNNLLEKGTNSPFYQAVQVLSENLTKVVEETRQSNWDILTD